LLSPLQSITSVFLIPRNAIDDDAARGIKEDGTAREKRAAFGFCFRTVRY
jgi:hypothetical protein